MLAESGPANEPATWPLLLGSAPFGSWRAFGLSCLQPIAEKVAQQSAARVGLRRKRRAALERGPQPVEAASGCLRCTVAGGRRQRGSRASLCPSATTPAPASDGGGKEPSDEAILSFPRDEASLNEMFREVEELMEDTQYKLSNAVKEMEAEEEGFKRIGGIDFEKLPPNYHNKSHADRKVGNKTIHTYQEINKAARDCNLRNSHLSQQPLSTAGGFFCFSHLELLPAAELIAVGRLTVALISAVVALGIVSESVGEAAPEVDNKTGSTSYSETVITSVREGEVKRNNPEPINLSSFDEFIVKKPECIIDEDCETGKYCEFSGLEYKCHVCKTQHTHCSRDVECCGHQLCVWGECRKAASRGENGTICENQHDCNPLMCCAFSKVLPPTDLLFPVCTPLPGAGEPCHDPSNRFLNLITWELEPDGALDRCPCTHGLICQTQSHSSDSLCELSSNKTQNEDNGKQVVADDTLFLDLVARDILGDYERLIKKGQDGLEYLTDEATDSEDLDLGSDLLLGDEM
ncbi:hypothetical protein lerEdw1_005388 [Lerista edwardsae]|nr:hypothetical protein lerEdw1_005388 [Lerista edwardsae]